MPAPEPTEPVASNNTLSNTSIATGDNSAVNIIQAAAGATVIIGAQVGAGLSALNDLARISPEVRAAVGAFSADFQAATQQVDVMGDYKDLHDLLHQIQFQVYNPMQRDSSRFPDEIYLEALGDYHSTLSTVIIKMNSVSGMNRVTPEDLGFIPLVVQAQADLKTAVDTQNADSLKLSLRRFSRVLTIHPAVIDTRLNSAARNLRLSSLVDALTSIEADLKDMKLDDDKVQKFSDGRDMLENMCARLDLLVVDHERWQTLDMNLRRIESQIEQDLFELVDTWDDLKSKASLLYSGSTDLWAASLQNYANQLDQFLAANDQPKIRTTFRKFRQEAGTRFYQVDFDLKTLCGELRKIGEPLSVIVRSLK